MATDKQIAANRRNALRSTGPRTPDGKNQARTNSTTHGMTASTTIYRAIRHEDPSVFAELRGKLFSDCQPVGTQEELAVEMMAAAYKRIQRVDAWEAALLDSGMESIQMNHGKALAPTDNDDLGCIIVAGKQQFKLTWDHIERYRRAAWLDYNRAQNQLRKLQQERIERPLQEFKAFEAQQRYLERTHVGHSHREPASPVRKPEPPDNEMASFCPLCKEPQNRPDAPSVDHPKAA